MDNGLFSIDSIAKYLGLSKRTIYTLVKNQEIDHVRIGSRILFTKQNLDDFISSKTINTKKS